MSMEGRKIVLICASIVSPRKLSYQMGTLIVYCQWDYPLTIFFSLMLSRIQLLIRHISDYLFRLTCTIKCGLSFCSLNELIYTVRHRKGIPLIKSLFFL